MAENIPTRAKSHLDAGANAGTVAGEGTGGGAGTGMGTGAGDAGHGRRARRRALTTGRGGARILRNTIRHLINDQSLDLAAGLAFYALLSMAPATLAMVSMLGVFGEAKSTTEAVLGLASDVSSEASEAIRPLVTELVSTPAAGMTLIVSVIVAIWSASKYVGAFGRALNRAYAVEEDRPFWKLKPMMLLITLVLLLVMVALGLLLVVSGPIAQSIGRLVGLGPVALLIWNVARWPVLVFFAMLMIAILYFATPNVRKAKFRWSSLGALNALIAVSLVSLGFVIYINNFSSYNAAYGTIGGVIVGFAWLWMVNLSLIFGAELDAEIERAAIERTAIERSTIERAAAKSSANQADETESSVERPESSA